MYIHLATIRLAPDIARRQLPCLLPVDNVVVVDGRGSSPLEDTMIMW